MFKSGAGSVGDSPDLGVSEFKPHDGCRDYLKSKKESKERKEKKERKGRKEKKERKGRKGREEKERKEGEMLKSLDKNY